MPPKGPSPLTPESPKSAQQQHRLQNRPHPRNPSGPPASSRPPDPTHLGAPKDPYPYNGASDPSPSRPVPPSSSDLLIADVPFDEAPCLELLPGFRISQAQAQTALDTYRREYVPAHPFVPLPEALTAGELYAQSRFLFWTVMSVVVPTGGSVQHDVRAWFRKYLAEHVVIRQEKRLDVLQAILIYLGWWVSWDLARGET